MEFSIIFFLNPSLSCLVSLCRVLSLFFPELPSFFPCLWPENLVTSPPHRISLWSSSTLLSFCCLESTFTLLSISLLGKDVENLPSSFHIFFHKTYQVLRPFSQYLNRRRSWVIPSLLQCLNEYFPPNIDIRIQFVVILNAEYYSNIRIFCSNISKYWSLKIRRIAGIK